MDRRESPPADVSICPKCSALLDIKRQDARMLFRCKDCQQVQAACIDCVLTAHEERPFNRILMWSADLGFWQPRTVAELGYTWHLGHSGDRCPLNFSRAREMVVIHEHGIMDLPVKFCQCPGEASEAEQLIQHGCWPAMWVAPGTAITLNMMETLHGLELQGQLNVHDYVKHLRRMTDGTESHLVKDRYREVNNSMREFRHVRARCRNGIDPGDRPGPGGLAVLCPACPQPGMNMRPGWQECAPEYRYVDALHYSIDGNFHLGLKAKDMDPNDVALSEGSGYFVNTTDFKTYLTKAPEQEAETSTCNQFEAMGTGKYKGQVSGIIALTCRHMFMLPGSIVDLLRGEKYRYVDFALVSTLQRYLILLLICGTYDIHCQYIKNLRKRLESQFGVVLGELDSIVSAELPELIAAIGKYHLCMHKGDCRYKHSLHFLPGSCMTDGETLERIWAVTNAIARRTREMSAGHRHDVLNDHYSDLNVRRLHTMVLDLMDKLTVAEEMHEMAREYLNSVEESLCKKDLVAWQLEEREWMQKVVDIKTHKDLENPFEPPRDAALTSRAIAEQLHGERLFSGEPEETGDVALVQGVLELRDRQDILRKEVLAFNREEKVRTKLSAKLDTFQEQVAACREVYDERLRLAVDAALANVPVNEYGPAFPARDGEDDFANGIPVTMMDIVDAGTFCLPSDYHSAVRRHPALADFVQIEWALRCGQANEALDTLRLHLTTHLAFEVRKTQGSSREHREWSDRRLEGKRVAINDAKARYRSLRKTLLVLGMPSKDPTYKELHDSDCKAFTLLVDETNKGDSYRLPTWIWGDFSFAKKLQPGEIKTFVLSATRAHWFRHRALCARWEEEVNCRLEEMWRTQTFFAYQEEWWLTRATALEKGDCRGSAVTARRYVRVLLLSTLVLIHSSRAYRWTRLRSCAEDTFPTTINQVGLYLKEGMKHTNS
ncbi:hypothetical protein C8Q79DRAFT_921614 [Trametes meyenii]|nr:hypothetical protein C8Q79DRAFT_921614 [Trametes meyenii]